MALWEYKIIGSGKGGFGSPSLLESHLNQLGKDEWEIIAFTSNPDNPLAFQGLARRTTQRDWTLQDAAAAAAKAEAEKLRAEFAAKFQAAQTTAAGPDEKPTTLVGDTAAPEDGFRRLRDTDRDQDPEALADNEEGDEFPLDSEDELPTFFDFIKPHMRRNQRGPGLSLAIDYLANKIDQSPSDVVVALRECGFVLPEREDDDPVYIEYDGDLFWVNTNRHHQLFINTKEKPRAVFRAVKGQPFAAPEKQDDRPARQDQRQRRPDDVPATDESKPKSDDQSSAVPAPDRAVEAERPERSERVEKPERAERSERNDRAPRQETSERQDRPERVDRQPAPGTQTTPNPEALPGGEALLARLRPMMRRNRRGPGISGSVGFLSRAMKQSEAELATALAAAGFPVPERPNDKPSFVDVGSWTYWINKDNRGGLWINGREKRDRDNRERGDKGPAGDPSVPASEAAPMPAGSEPSDSGSSSPESDASAQGSEAPAENTPDRPYISPTLVHAEKGAEPVAASTPEATPANESAPEPAPSPAAESLSSEAPRSTPSSASEEPAISAITETSAESTEAPDSDLSAAPTTPSGPLAPIRLLLKAKPRGAGASGEITSLARALNQSPEELLKVLTDAGLALPPANGDKSETLSWGDETLWLNASDKDGALWLNAKAAKPARKPRAAGSAKRPSKKSAKSDDSVAE